MNHFKHTNQENTITLLHLKTDAIKALENFEKKQSSVFLTLLEIFLHKIRDLSYHIYVSYENTSSIIKLISQSTILQESEVTELTYHHEIELLKQLYKNKNLQSVIHFNQVQPLLDLQVLDAMFQIHTKYQADYTYSENIPEGLAPVLYGSSLIQTLEVFSIKFPKDFSNVLPLQDIITKKIDQFHTEIYYDHTQDLRMLRLDFSLNSYRSQQELIAFTNQLQQKSDPKILNTPYSNLLDILKKTSKILTKFPSYIELEIISSCSYACTFCPRQYLEIPDNQLSIESIQKVLQYIQLETQGTSICLGGLGEPTEHPQCLDILLLLLEHQAIQTVVLETNGYYLESLKTLIKHPNFSKLKIILNINSIKNYQKIHGFQGFQKVESNLKLFLQNIQQTYEEQFPLYQKNIILQILKMEENEAELEQLHSFSQKYNITFLLQKYNSYIQLMPEKRVSNMTPLERSPCWHLRRDLFIRANGDVSFCKQDIQNTSIRGNIHTDSVKSIWQKQEKSFQENINNKLSQKPNCAQCDEYFTFNL